MLSCSMLANMVAYLLRPQVTPLKNIGAKTFCRMKFRRVTLSRATRSAEYDDKYNERTVIKPRHSALLNAILPSVVFLTVMAPTTQQKMFYDNVCRWKTMNRKFSKGWILFQNFNFLTIYMKRLVSRGHIFSHVRPFHERAVSNLDKSMHRSLWI